MNDKRTEDDQNLSNQTRRTSSSANYAFPLPPLTTFNQSPMSRLNDNTSMWPKNSLFYRQIKCDGYRFIAKELPANSFHPYKVPNTSAPTPTLYPKHNAQMHVHHMPIYTKHHHHHPTLERTMAPMMNNSHSIHRWESLIPIIHPIHSSAPAIVLTAREDYMPQINSTVKPFSTAKNVSHFDGKPFEASQLNGISNVSKHSVSDVVTGASIVPKQIAPSLIPMNSSAKPKLNTKLIFSPIIRFVPGQAIKKSEDSTGDETSDEKFGIKITFEENTKKTNDHAHDRSDDEDVTTIHNHLETTWNAFPTSERHNNVVAAKRNNNNNQIDSSPTKFPKYGIDLSQRSSKHQSTVALDKNEFSPALQEYPADYETILFEFQ